MQKAADEADIIFSDNDGDSDNDKCYESAQSKQNIAEARHQLESLLRTSLTTRQFMGKYPTMTGSLPNNLHKQQLTAVQSLQNDQTSSKEINTNKSTSSRRPKDQFKGFKKRKLKKKLE